LFLGSLVAAIGVVRERWSNASAFWVLVLQTIGAAIGFGGIHAGYGLDGAAEPGWADGLYFSVVTLTTLGYGDFQPKPALRLVAAGQAVLGYVYLGMIVAVSLRSRAKR